MNFRCVGWIVQSANTAAYEADRATAEKMIKKGKMSLEDIADCVPSLSLDELKGIEALCKWYRQVTI